MTARLALILNASFSAASAVFIVAARKTLYPLFALDSDAILVMVAVGLMAYAILLGFAARRRSTDRRTLLTAAALDAGWVVGTAVVLVAAWTQLAPSGRALLIGAGVVVEVFATLQFWLARSTARERAG